MSTPAWALWWPASHVRGAGRAPVAWSISSGYSPRLQTLPWSSWAMKASSSSARTPSWKSRSHSTTVRTWSTHLVTLVTVKTTSCVPAVVVPVRVNCRPGTSGRNRLPTVVERAENRLTEKSFSVTGRAGAGPTASALGAGSAVRATSAAAPASWIRYVRIVRKPPQICLNLTIRPKGCRYLPETALRQPTGSAGAVLVIWAPTWGALRGPLVQRGGGRRADRDAFPGVPTRVGKAGRLGAGQRGGGAPRRRRRGDQEEPGDGGRARRGHPVVARELGGGDPHPVAGRGGRPHRPADAVGDHGPGREAGAVVGRGRAGHRPLRRSDLGGAAGVTGPQDQRHPHQRSGEGQGPDRGQRRLHRVGPAGVRAPGGGAGLPRHRPRRRR